MFKNYFKIAFRNLARNKSYAAINIFGLAMGLAIALLITLFVVDELSYDKYNLNADRIYRVNSDFKVRGSVFNDKDTPAPLAAAMLQDYPQIENAVRIKETRHTLVKSDSQTFIENNSFYADPSIFAVFTLPMIAGDPKTALLQPHSLVVSEDIANKYFNGTDITGKTLRLDNVDYKITGVIKDMPLESHIHLNLIKSMSGFDESKSTEWLNVNFMTFLLVRNGVSEKNLDGYLSSAAKAYAEPGLKSFVHSSIADLEKVGDHFRFVAIPLIKIHLHSTLTNEIEPSENVQYVYVFMIITILILVIAAINFVNLSTARSADRSKEVGVRKVLGANRSSLIYQFLTESVITSFTALIIALFIAFVARPYFNELCGKEIAFNLFSTTWLLPALLIVTLAIGILGGIYPAIFISGVHPVRVLKGSLATGFKGGWLRNGLIVFQFTTVIALIVGTLVIYSQLKFIHAKNVGYNREQVLVLQNTGSLGILARSFKQDVLKIAGVKSGTLTSFVPTAPSNNDVSLYTKDASMRGAATTISQWTVDEDYIPTMEMNLAAGRNFSGHMLTDSNAVILNETAAYLLGYREAAGKNVYLMDGNKGQPFKIIGVVKDFNYGSLRNKTSPLILKLGYNNKGMAFRVDTRNLPALISQIETLYHKADANIAGQPFSYSFMDDDFNHLYQSEKNTGKIFISFTVFSILIACLGLFGLVTYAAEQRTKEIGIRKVLGASVNSIVSMLSADFLKLVGVAGIIAFPTAWWAMNKWLQGFAYRTNISPWVFAIAGLLALIITIATVSFRAIKAALTNPVTSLRSE